MLSATLVALLLPGALLVRWQLVSDTPVEFVGVPGLPSQIGPWTEDGENRLDAEVFAIIEPDAYLMKHYSAPGRTPIWLYLGVYAGRAGYGSGAHDPAVCYPAQGWEILASERFEVPLSNAATLHAQRLEAHLGSAKEAVLYWFQPASRWPAPAAVEELLQVVDAVSGRPQYAFVRLSGPEDGDAVRDLEEFAALIAKPVRTYVESGSMELPTNAAATGEGPLGRHSP